MSPETPRRAVHKHAAAIPSTHREAEAAARAADTGVHAMGVGVRAALLANA